MKRSRHVIEAVMPGSIAEELNMEPGDELLRINDMPIEDIFDYRYLCSDEYIEVLLKKKESGEEWLLEIEKDADEELGITFASSLMDDYRSCRNRCIFCFIDQMPKGMRDTLYFKDDDSRLSFLQGNYVTLTNMNDHDIDRIIRYRMEPINISFQTTNPELRVKMLHNRHAGEVFPKVKRLAEAGIEMNGQIVLCRGINDGAELERSISDLYEYLPALRSVSVVPVGLSKYREGLYPLEPFTREDAREVLAIIHRWQEKAAAQWGLHFVHASDEWYLLAGEELPEEESYDGYLQLENGVGMLRLLRSEFAEALEERTRNRGREAERTDALTDGKMVQGGAKKMRQISIATGLLAAGTLEELARMAMEAEPDTTITVFPVRNDFFGELITVSGLITGQDLIRQLKGRALGDALLIPCNMLRSGENVFLDDVTVEQVIEELEVPVIVVDPEGEDLVRAIFGEKQDDTHRRRQMYEQTDRSDSREA